MEGEMEEQEKNTLDTESLMLDAKKAILEEQHRRFQELQAAGMWPEAMQQLHVTLACAADLLKDSVALLERAVERRRRQQAQRRPNTPSSEEGPQSP
ncbi:MAG: hypothetical protein D6704_05515 [Nitrospirae bacterium]|nr:MAG: hypothetical protein D6704_05515 [Nitrospirota bacterium]